MTIDVISNLREFSLALVASGIFLLCLSLYLTYMIRRGNVQQKIGWNILLVLIVFFIVTYGVFASMLFKAPVGHMELIVSFILCGGGIFVVMVVYMSGVTIRHIERIAAMERHRAMHDDLTELPNRMLLILRIQQAIENMKYGSEKVAVLLMDLDRFKEINDTLGHYCGDILLAQLAPRLKRAVRRFDTVARLGGDEFAVVLPGASIDRAVEVARKLAKTAIKPYFVEGHAVSVGASIGITLYPNHGLDADSLLKNAEVAMYAAKKNATSFAIYDINQDVYSVNRLNMVTELKTGINKDQLFLQFQPKLNLKTQQLYSVEALLRWQHPEAGLIYPDEFICLAEQSGLIHELSLWVVKQAVKQQRLWKKAGLNFKVSINLSAKNFQESEFIRQLSDIFKHHATDPAQIIFEITETSMMINPEFTHEVLTRLQALGVTIAVDDFGTGYSSLTYLKKLPVDVIKIDKSFVMDMADDDNDAVIVRSTIDLAHNMGMSVIAEGVESQDSYDVLEILGCDYAQGFHICKPVTADNLQTWLRDFKPRPCLLN